MLFLMLSLITINILFITPIFLEFLEIIIINIVIPYINYIYFINKKNKQIKFNILNTSEYINYISLNFIKIDPCIVSIPYPLVEYKSDIETDNETNDSLSDFLPQNDLHTDESTDTSTEESNTSTILTETEEDTIINDVYSDEIKNLEDDHNSETTKDKSKDLSFNSYINPFGIDETLGFCKNPKITSEELCSSDETIIVENIT